MGIVAVLIIIMILTFTFSFHSLLTFIKAVNDGDERVMNQSKIAAVICFTIAITLFIGFIYLIAMFQLM